MLTRILMFVTAMVVLLIAVNVTADELRLKNGDHITGTMLRMENEVLIFKTSYAGEISIKWGEIATISTDAPIKVILGDETSVSGIATPGESGKMKVKADQILDPLTFDLAQVELINPKPPEPAVKLTGRINIGASVTKGNSDNKNIYADSELVARTENNRFTLGGQYNRAEDDGEKSVDNKTGYIKYDHFLTEKWYFIVNATGTQDKFKDLNLRTSAGPGLGYQFLETPFTNLSIEAGVSYVNEDFEDFDKDGDVAEDDGYPAGRWAVNFDRYLLKKHVQFFHFHEGLFGFERSDDIVIRSQTGFRLPIYEGFNSTIQLNYDWDNSPSTGMENTDKTYIFTLGYQW